MLATENAIVYRGGGRRWFSVQAAANAEARKKLKSRCECSGGYDGETCSFHQDGRYQTLVRRLARIYLKASGLRTTQSLKRGRNESDNPSPLLRPILAGSGEGADSGCSRLATALQPLQ